MLKIIFLLFILLGLNYAQTFKVEKTSGSVKAQKLSSENWVDVKENDDLMPGTLIMTGKNSSIFLKTGAIHFTLKEYSVLPVSSLKKMNTDELLLALAMENILNAPKNKGGNKSRNTAVYGTKSGQTASDTPAMDNSEGFGLKRINGAVQLAENGYKESSVITAKETFRKYPDTKKLVYYRIYFADILYECGLYAEALDEYTDIKTLTLTDQEKAELERKLELASKKLAMDE